MSHCVDKNHADVIETAEKLKQPPIVIAAVFALWQEQNNNFNTFPNLETTKQLLSLQETSTDIYNKLGTKTQSENVTIVPNPISAAKAYGGIAAYRNSNDPNHWGNPFASTSTTAKSKFDLLDKGTVKEATTAFIDWLTTDKYKEIEPKRRENLIEQLKSGKLKDQPIYYYKELKEPSHATALDYLINKYDWKTKEEQTEQKVQEIPSKPINIYAGTNENAELSNLANRPFILQGVEYGSVEQYFQLQKFQTAGVLEFNYDSKNAQQIADKIAEIADKIANSKSGFEAKKLGGTRIAGVTLNEQFWNSINSSEMKKAIKASFEQNPKALQQLLATGNAILTHNQESVKSKWRTEFPKLLMEVRAELAQQYVEVSTPIQEIPQVEESTPLTRQSRPDQILVNNKILTEAEVGYLLDGMTFYYTKTLFDDAKMVEEFMTPDEKGIRKLPAIKLDNVRANMALALDTKVDQISSQIEELEKQLKGLKGDEKIKLKTQIDNLTFKAVHIQFVIKQVLGFDSDAEGVFNIDLGAPANFKILQDRFTNQLDLIGLKAVEDSKEDFTEKSGSDSMVNIPAMYLDPKKSMSATIRLLLSSIPQLNEKEGIIRNDFGLQKMTDANTSFNRLAWHLTENLPQGNFTIQRQKIEELSQRHPEYKRLLQKLGVTTPNATISSERLRTEFTVTFSQTKLKFLQAIIDNDEYKLLDANTETTADRIRSNWRANYLEIINSQDWPQTEKRIKQTLAKLNKLKEFNHEAKLLTNTILTDLGLYQVADETLESEFTGGDIRTMLDEIVKRGLNNPNMFWEKGIDKETRKNEILGRINELVKTEAKYNKSTTDLQFLDETGKPVYGIVLNTYLTNLVQEINYTVENGKLDKEFPWIVNDHFNQNSLILKHLQNGGKIETGVLKSIKSADGETSTGIAQGDIGDMISADMVAAFQGKNQFPTTGDREVKATWSISDEPLLPFDKSENETIQYFIKHLKAELLAATDSTNKEIMFIGREGEKFPHKKLRLLKDVFNIPIVDEKLKQDDLTEEEIDKFILQNRQKLHNAALSYVQNYVAKKKDWLTKLGFGETYDVYGKYDARIGRKIKTATPIDTPVTFLANKEKITVSYDEAVAYYSHLKLVGLIEGQKFFFGDPAMYKTPDDAFKRFSLFTATKKVARTDPEFIKWLNNLKYKNPKTGQLEDVGYNLSSKNPTIPVWTVQDPIHDGTLDSAIQEMYKIQEAQIKSDIEKSDLTAEAKKTLLEVKMNALKAAYNEFKKADSQGWMNDKTARLIKLMHGLWTELDETIYNKYLTKFDPNNKETFLPREYYPRISPIKSQHVGPMADYPNKYVPTTLKHSLLRLTPELVHNKRFSELLDVVDVLFDGVALVQTVSGVKFGARLNSKGELDNLFNSDGTINQNPESVHHIYLKYFGEQQNLDPVNKLEGTSGVQQRKLVLQDNSDQGITINEDLAKLEKRYIETQNKLFELQWSEFINKSGLTTVTDKKGKISYFLGSDSQSRSKLVSALSEIINKRQVSNNVKEAIEMFMDERMLLDAVPGKRKIESLFLAPIREALSREYRNGGMRVLASYTGLESIQEEQGLAWYKYNGPNEQVSPCEVILPPAYKQFVKKGDIIMIFRIPSTGAASIDICKVKDFAPVGDVIFGSPHLLPKTNADHDVDKVIIFLPNYDENNNYISSEGDSVEALQNRMLELTIKLMLHPSKFKSLTTPVGDGIINHTGKELKITQEDKTKIEDLKDFQTNFEKAFSFHSGKQLISSLSIYTTQLPLKQKVNLYWNTPTDKFHVFFNYKTTEINKEKYPSLANLLDTQGNRISELFTEMTQHALDVQNKDTISQLGVNMFTVPVWALLTDLGVNQTEILSLLNHQIVRKYIEFKRKNNRTSRDRGSDNWQDNLKSSTEHMIRAFLNQQNIKLKYENLLSTMEYNLERAKNEDNQERIEELEPLIEERDNELREFRKIHSLQNMSDDTFNGRILEEYLELERLARWYNKFSLAIRPDADAVGSTSIEGFKDNIDTRNDVINSGLFGNIDKLFNQTFLEPMYKYSHAMHGTYDNLIIALHPSTISTGGPTIREKVKEIKEMLKGYKSKEDLVRFSNQIDDELLVAILMKTNQFNFVNNKDLIIENSNRLTVAQQLLEFQKPTSPIRDNPFIDMLTVESKTNIMNIVLKQRTMDPVTQNQVTNGFEELLSSSNPDERKFASDYARFAIIQGGFTGSYYNLINTVPTLTLTEMVLDTYDRFLKQTNKESFFQELPTQLGKQDPTHMFQQAHSKTGKSGLVEMKGKIFETMPYLWKRTKTGTVKLYKNTYQKGEKGWLFALDETIEVNQNYRNIKTYWAPEMPKTIWRSGEKITDEEANKNCE